MLELVPLRQRYLVSEVKMVKFTKDGKLLVVAGIERYPRGVYLFHKDMRPFLSIVSKDLGVRQCKRGLLVSLLDDSIVIGEDYNFLRDEQECETDYEEEEEYKRRFGVEISYVLKRDRTLVFGTDGIMRVIENERIKSLFLDAIVLEARVCKGRLILMTPSSVLIMNENYERLAKVDFKRVEDWAFNPSCDYVAVADSFGHSVKIHDLDGKLVASIEYLPPLRIDFDFLLYVPKSYREPRAPLSIDWYEDMIAVGMSNGKLYVYKVLYP